MLSVVQGLSPLTLMTSKVTDNGIGALQLNVSGNGTSGQLLASDGDGTFSWQTGGSGGNETLALRPWHLVTLQVAQTFLYRVAITLSWPQVLLLMAAMFIS